MYNIILPFVILTRFSSLFEGFQVSFIRQDKSLSFGYDGINNWRGRQCKVQRHGNNGEFFARHHYPRSIVNNTVTAIRKISNAGVFKFRSFLKSNYLKISTALQWMMQPDWIEIIGRIIGFFEFMDKKRKNIKWRRLPFLNWFSNTSHPIYPSTPPTLDMVQSANKSYFELKSGGMVSPTENTDGRYISKYTAPVPEDSGSMLKVYKLGKRVVRTVPESALFGLLALISTELLQREVAKQATNFPPLMRSLANTTMSELDLKLDLLTYLNWDLDPFIQSEIENLQLQPWEAIDRFIVNDFLAKIDVDISPSLAKLVADPKKVQEITKNIKDLVQLLAYVLIGNGATEPTSRLLWRFPTQDQMGNLTSFYLPAARQSIRQPIEQTTNSILANVDTVGLGVEGVVNEWNRLLENLSQLVKAESLLTVFQQQQLQIQQQQQQQPLQSNQTMYYGLEKFLKKVSNVQLNVSVMQSSIATDHKKIANNWYNWMLKFNLMEMNMQPKENNNNNISVSSSEIERNLSRISKRISSINGKSSS